MAVHLLVDKMTELTGEEKMKIFITSIASLVLLAAAGLTGCSAGPTQSADVSENVRKSLDQAGLKDVTISQDRDKGVVTLGGNVATEAAKTQAELIAKTLATGQVVALQIAVIPVGGEKEARAIHSALDEGIENNLKAALIQNKLQADVKYDVKNAVVTLKGEVQSEARRAAVEQIAANVPNVKQVVNTLQVKNQKATSTV